MFFKVHSSLNQNTIPFVNDSNKESVLIVDDELSNLINSLTVRIKEFIANPEIFFSTVNNYGYSSPKKRKVSHPEGVLVALNQIVSDLNAIQENPGDYKKQILSCINNGFSCIPGYCETDKTDQLKADLDQMVISSGQENKCKI